MILISTALCLIKLCQGQNISTEDVTEEIPVYDLIFDSALYTCADETSMKNVDTSGTWLESNETMTSINGNLTFFHDLPSNNLRLEFFAKKEMSGRLETVFTKAICDLCEELHPESEYWTTIQYFGYPSKCPFTAGTYFLKSLVPPKDGLPISGLNNGEYQLSTYYYYNPGGDCLNYGDQIFLFCFMVDLVVERVN